MYKIASNYSRMELTFQSNGRDSYTVALSGPGVHAEATLELADEEEDAFDHPAWFFQSIARHRTPWLDVESFSAEGFSIDAECSPSGIVSFSVSIAGTTGTETWTVSAPLTVEIDQLADIAKGVVAS
jgi:hypothetical protein